MASNTADIIARLTLNGEQFSAKSAQLYGDMERNAKEAANRTKTAFDTSFTEIQNLAKRALTLPRTETGALNLDAGAAREAAVAAQNEATALREIATAARLAAINTGDTTSETRLYVQAASAAAIEAERNAVELNQQAVALDRLQAELGQTAIAMTRHNEVARQATVSAGAQRAGMQQLSFQIGDMATMWAMGAKPMQIFASQGAQVIGAVSMMTNSTKGFLGFIGGPWGQVISAGAIVLTTLANSFFSAGEEAEKSAGKVDRYTESLNRMMAASGRATVADLGLNKVRLLQLQGWRDNPDADPEMPKEGRRARGGGRAGDIARALRRKELDTQIFNLEATVAGIEKARAAQGRLDAATRASAAADKAAGTARREYNKELREAESAASKAAKEQEKLAKWLNDTRAEASGNVDKAARDIAEQQKAWGKDQVTVGETMIQRARDLEALEDARAEGARQVLDAYLRQLDAMQRIGGLSGTVAGIVAGIADGGNFAGVGGDLGKLLNLLGPTIGGEGWKSVTDKLDEIFGGTAGSGTFASSMRNILQSASFGTVGGSIIFGSSQNSLLSGLGGIAGKELLGGALEKGLGSLASGALGKTLGSMGGPIAGIVGGMVGSALGGLLSKTKKASSTISIIGGEAAAGAASGNSSAYRTNATTLGGGVSDQLNAIAEALGGELGGTAGVSIGQRKKKFVVDTTGRGKTKGGGVLSFDTEEEAVIAAVRNALSDGVLTGISQAAQNILRSGQDLEKAITKAALIESVPKELLRRTDPLAYAVSEVDAKFAKIVAALKEGGASAEQMADAQKLYNLELAEAKENAGSASQSLKDFLASMKAGSSSPFSLADQEVSARAVLDPYLGQINRGESIDQDKYLAAAQTFLDIERQLYGSTSKYFDALGEIQAATNSAIGTIDNATPIRTTADPFIEATANASKSTAASASNMETLLAQQNELLAKLIAAQGGTAESWINQTRGYA